MKTLLLAAVATVALSASAHAQRESNITVARLLTICQDQRLSSACTAYIDGVADAAGIYQKLRPADGTAGGTLPGYICIPASQTGTQIRQSVIQSLRGRPDDAQKVAGGAVLSTLLSNYPCTAR